MKRLTLVSISAVLAFFLAAILPLAAHDKVAIDGYDPVATLLPRRH